MTRRAVSISLKIPDNEAYTALIALRRLDVEVARVERSEIFIFDEDRDDDALLTRITADETIFNPNKHRIALLSSPRPRRGEVWIEPLEEPRRGPIATCWQLFDARNSPVKRPALDAAIDRLLCNPAIERAVTSFDASDGDNPLADE